MKIFSSYCLLFDNVTVKFPFLDFREVPSNNIPTRRSDDSIFLLPFSKIEPKEMNKTFTEQLSGKVRLTLQE